jgi:hypothetical protein
MLSPIDVMLNLRHKFEMILDVDSGDGACALSLLDNAIEAAKDTIRHYGEPPPQVFRFEEAVEHLAREHFSEMSFDEVHDLAVQMLEDRIAQLTLKLKHAEDNRTDSEG